MKVLLFVASTLFLAQAFAAPSPSKPSDVIECVESVINDVKNTVKGLIEWFNDVRDTYDRLQAQKQRCDDLPRNGEFYLLLIVKVLL